MQAEAAIRIAGLTFHYPGGPVVLDDVHCAVAPGESVALIGPNGAGKSTLFLCLSGVLSGKARRIEVAGIDPSDRSRRRELPSQVGIVFQNCDDQLFNTTVFEDVAFGPLNLGLPADEVRRRVGFALDQVGLQGFDERVPHHLSGGEKRRVALAGVLAMGPQILLLDEPSIHLDPRGRREFIALLNSLPVTKIIASHDMELVRETCRRAVLLDRGRVVADGPVDSLLADAVLMEQHGLEVPYSLRASSPRSGLAL